jgi:TonB family protein
MNTDSVLLGQTGFYIRETRRLPQTCDFRTLYTAGGTDCTQGQDHWYFRSIFVFARKPDAVFMCSARAMRLNRFASRRMVALTARIVLLALATATACCAQEERKAIQRPAPVYPAFARHLNLSGTVKIKVVVNPDGQVKHVEVVGGHPLLVNAAVDAVKQWKFAPAKTETPIELEFHFQP